jgi:hypothetical protein
MSGTQSFPPVKFWHLLAMTDEERLSFMSVRETDSAHEVQDPTSEIDMNLISGQASARFDNRGNSPYAMVGAGHFA